MRKAIYITAALLLTFASADATGRRTASGTKIQVVYREQEHGEWQTYLFGATCYGTLELKQPKTFTEPITIVCR